MYLLQLYVVLWLGTSLSIAALSETSRGEANTCTVMTCSTPSAKGERGQQGPPGKAGPPGSSGIQGSPGQKGQKGDTAAVDSIQGKVTALERTVRTLQADVSKNRKILMLQGPVSIGEKTFVSSGKEDTFFNGKALCASAGGVLATPRNAAENTALTSIAKSYSKYAFLSINDIQKEGTFVYPDGTPLRYANWAKGEPNDYHGSEDCVILREDSEWNDFSCNHKTLIICEI